jgi:hypothetical protein
LPLRFAGDIPHLTRSSLHRCLERHGISRLPEVEGAKPGRKKFDSYPIGFFHIDLAEVRTAEGKLYLFMAIDRTSKFAFVELVERADMQAAARFLQALIAAVPYRITPCSPTTASSSLICQRIERDQPPAFAASPSIAPACCMASTTDLPNRTIPGQTAKSSA